MSKVESYVMTTTGQEDPRFKDLYLFHGKSAYQAAVEQGFVGTEMQWIASLMNVEFNLHDQFQYKNQWLLYVATDYNHIYRYDEENDVYVQVGVPLGETEITAYRGDRGKIAYDHSQKDHDFLFRKGGTMTGDIQSMNIAPKADNAYNLGSSDLRYKNVYAVNFIGAFTGNSSTATTLQTARTINGTSFNGGENITTATWGTARDITIGLTTKSVNGSAAYSWSLAEIGALPAAGGTMTGAINSMNIAPKADNTYNLGTGSLRYASVYGVNVNAINVNTTLLNAGYLELSHATPFIDFHFNKSTTDYTSRIIESSSGVLNINGVTFSSGVVTGALTGNASTATLLQTARTINGTAFNGGGNITTATWGTARTITIGNTGKSVNGSANVSWTLAEIGASASGHTHNYAGSASAGGDATNALKLNGYASSSAATANTIALRNANGYLFAAYFNQSSAAESATTSSYIMFCNSDGYLRKGTLASIKTALGLGSAAYTASTAYATSDHTHSYLPLAGGTLTGQLTARHVIPSANNSYNCGNSSYRWANVYGVIANFSGAVTLGSTVTGSGNWSTSGTITGSKVYNAVWNDYAEWYEKENLDEVFEPGDIVTWNETGVKKTETVYDKCVVGVYSDTYGHIIGGEVLEDMEDNIEKFVPVGVAGRCLVKVIGKVNRGDLIISSNEPGIGRAINNNDAVCDTCGCVVGKALESKNDEGINKIKIQIMLA